MGIRLEQGQRQILDTRHMIEQRLEVRQALTLKLSQDMMAIFAMGEDAPEQAVGPLVDRVIASQPPAVAEALELFAQENRNLW